MDDRTKQFRVGATVVATIIVGAILVTLFGKPERIFQPTYTIYIYFSEVRGVNPETAIRMHGIMIGRVTDVEFGENQEGVIVTAKIQKKVPLQKRDVCYSTAALLGDSDLEIVRPRDPNLSKKEVAQLSEPLQEGDTMMGVANRDPMRVVGNLEGDIKNVMVSVTKTSDQIGELASQVNDLLKGNDEQLSRIIDKVETTIDGLQVAVGNVNGLVGDTKVQADLKQSIAEMPQLLQNAREAVTRIQQAASSVNENLDNLKGLTKPLGERGPEIVANVERSTARLEQVLNELGRFSTSLNNPDGSLGQLLNDPELYHKLTSTIDNVEHLTRRLRPILEDARVITDKIARDPSRVIRGALKPEAPIKYAR